MTYGAGRSIVVDRDGEIIAGHHTAEAAAAAGLKRTVVDTTGAELVVVKRTDLDANDPRATGMALADNRAGDLNRRWDARQVTTDAAAGLLDASAIPIFASVEMADFTAELNKPAAAAIFPEETTHEGRIARALDPGALAR